MPGSHSAWRGSPVINGIQHEFHAAGDTELFEDAVEVFLDGVLAEVEFAGDLAVTDTFRDESDDLFLARGEHAAALGIEHAQRGDFRDMVHEVVELLGAGPDLSVGHAEKALAQRRRLASEIGEMPRAPERKALTTSSRSQVSTSRTLGISG